MADPGTILNGRFRLDRLVGQGGFAQVFLSTDLVLGRQVAVKVLRPEQLADLDTGPFLERFDAEARLIARLEHPNVLGLHDYGRSDDLTYLVMPYVAGGSLHDARRRVGRFSPAQVAGYLRQIAAALDYAHANNIVHRDIKPQNLLLRAGSDHLLVADFGIAKVLAEGGTQSGTAVIGSAAYMAPEQFQGRVGRATDIYALGCVAFELLTGTPPYPGPAERSMFGHIYGALPRLDASLPAASPALQAVLDRALAKLPEDRFPSAGALSAAFAAALAAPDAATRPIAPPTDEQATRRLDRPSTTSPLSPAAAPSTPPSTLAPAFVAPTAALPAAPPASPPPRSLVPWLAAGLVTLLVLTGIGVWIAVNRPDPPPIATAPYCAAAPAAASGAARAGVARAVIPLPGHTERVERAAWSPDGAFLATASEDKSVRWWRKDGTLLRTLTAHTAAVRGLAWSPDRKRLATGDNAGSVLVWEEAASPPNEVYRGNGFGVSALAWSPDGHYLIVANDQIRRLNVDTWRERASLGASNEAKVFAWSPRGALAVGGKAGSLRLFGTDGTLIADVVGHTGDVTSIACSPGGDRLVSAGGNLLLWDARTGQRLASFAGHTGNANSVAWSPDGQTLASGADDRTVRLWRPDGSALATLPEHAKEVTQVAWLRDGTLVSGDKDSILRWWSASGTLLGQEKAAGCGVWHLAPSPTDLRVAVTLYCGTAELWP